MYLLRFRVDFPASAKHGSRIFDAITPQMRRGRGRIDVVLLRSPRVVAFLLSLAACRAHPGAAVVSDAEAPADAAPVPSSVLGAAIVDASANDLIDAAAIATTAADASDAGAEAGASTVWSPDGTVPDDFRLTYSQGACFGPCPIYKVTVDGKGHRHFAGRRSTDGTTRSFEGGCSDAILSDAQMKEMLTLLETNHVFTLNPGAGVAMTDVSEIVLTLRANGRTRRLVNGSSPELRRIQDGIDRLSGAEHLSTSDAPLRSCREADSL